MRHTTNGLVAAVLVVLTTGMLRGADVPVPGRREAQAALKPYGGLVGDWRGVGQPERNQHALWAQIEHSKASGSVRCMTEKPDKRLRTLEKAGAPGGTRTPGLLVRSQSLYPAELRARVG